MKRASVKESMKKAILQLMKKKNFLDITVTDLIKAAGISRASFYRTHRSVDEVLDDIVIDIKNFLDTNVIPFLRSDDETVVKRILTEFFVKLKEGHIQTLELLPENTNFLMGKLEKHSVILNYDQSQTTRERYFFGLYLVTVIWIGKTWAHYNYPETVEEIVDYTYKVIYRKSSESPSKPE